MGSIFAELRSFIMWMASNCAKFVVFMAGMAPICTSSTDLIESVSSLRTKERYFIGSNA